MKLKSTQVVTETPEQLDALLDVLRELGLDHSTTNYEPEEESKPNGHAKGRGRPAGGGGSRLWNEVIQPRLRKGAALRAELARAAEDIGMSPSNIDACCERYGARKGHKTVDGRRQVTWRLPT